MENGAYETVDAGAEGLAPMLAARDKSRVSLRYMASLFSAGNEDIVREVYYKLMAVRIYMRGKTVQDVTQAEVDEALALAGLSGSEAEAIFRLTSLPTYEERFVVPPMERETAIQAQFPDIDPLTRKASTGFGFREDPARRW